MFPYPIGFSDHSPGIDMDIAAISMGASLIEKLLLKTKKQKVSICFQLKQKIVKTLLKKLDLWKMHLEILDVNLQSRVKNRKNVRRSPYVKATAQINTP